MKEINKPKLKYFYLRLSITLHKQRVWITFESVLKNTCSASEKQVFDKKASKYFEQKRGEIVSFVTALSFIFCKTIFSIENKVMLLSR